MAAPSPSSSPTAALTPDDRPTATSFITLPRAPGASPKSLLTRSVHVPQHNLHPSAALLTPRHHHPPLRPPPALPAGLERCAHSRLPCKQVPPAAPLHMDTQAMLAAPRRPGSLERGARGYPVRSFAEMLPITRQVRAGAALTTALGPKDRAETARFQLRKVWVFPPSVTEHQYQLISISSLSKLQKS